MNNTTYVIRPASNGFIVDNQDSDWSKREESICSTWDDVINFIKDKPVRFYVPENVQQSATTQVSL